MQIIINIPKVFYEAVRKIDVIISDQRSGKSFMTKVLMSVIFDAVANGIPLPKGHGKLKDIDNFIKRVEEDRKHACYLHSWTADDVIDYLSSDSYAPVIIEADESEETDAADNN